PSHHVAGRADDGGSRGFHPGVRLRPADPQSGRFYLERHRPGATGPGDENAEPAGAGDSPGPLWHRRPDSLQPRTARPAVSCEPRTRPAAAARSDPETPAAGRASGPSGSAFELILAPRSARSPSPQLEGVLRIAAAGRFRRRRTRSRQDLRGLATREGGVSVDE